MPKTTTAAAATTTIEATGDPKKYLQWGTSQQKAVLAGVQANDFR
jgi:hypothetical protein